MYKKEDILAIIFEIGQSIKNEKTSNKESFSLKFWEKILVSKKYPFLIDFDAETLFKIYTNIEAYFKISIIN